MKTILAVILAMLVALSTTNAVDEETLLKDLKPDCESVATFIEDNFDLFVTKCNEDSGENWKAKGIEYKEYITISTSECELKGLFLDFNEDNGYAVLADDYIMYDFQTEGESPYKSLEEYDELFYSSLVGYGYVLDGSTYDIDVDYNEQNDFENLNFCASNDIDYENIEDTELAEYVSKKYKGFSLAKSKHLNMDILESQWTLKVYNTYTSPLAGGEGNCWAVSSYYVLQYYADNFYSNLAPTSKAATKYYDPATSEPRIYSLYFDEDGNNISGDSQYHEGRYNIQKAKFERGDYYFFPAIWNRMRVRIDKLYGYKESIVKGGTMEMSAKLIKDIAGLYRFTLNTSYTDNWNKEVDTAITNLNNYNPLIWCTGNRSSWGPHAMACCGYKLYTKTTTIFFVKTVSEKIFLELATGNRLHYIDKKRNIDRLNTIYYDLSRHIGAGGFIFVSR